LKGARKTRQLTCRGNNSNDGEFLVKKKNYRGQKQAALHDSSTERKEMSMQNLYLVKTPSGMIKKIKKLIKLSEFVMEDSPYKPG
jgi:hypothetical protein